MRVATWIRSGSEFKIRVSQRSNDVSLLKRRIFYFLAGLHNDFDKIRLQILGKDTLLSLRETFVIVRLEGQRHNVRSKHYGWLNISH